MNTVHYLRFTIYDLRAGWSNPRRVNRISYIVNDKYFWIGRELLAPTNCLPIMKTISRGFQRRCREWIGVALLAAVPWMPSRAQTNSMPAPALRRPNII